MEMTLLNRTITLGPEKVAYNDCRKQFQSYAQEADAMFRELYERNTTLEQLVKDAPAQVGAALRPVFLHCVDTLIENGIMDVDEERFFNDYQEEINQWSEPYLHICDQYAEIVMTEEQLDEYRVARREGRGRVIGGGFGLSGAVKGMATAGAVNMVAGAGHMLFNGAAKIVSSVSANRKMSKILHSENTLEALVGGVRRTAFACHFALIDCLARAGKDALNVRDYFLSIADEGNLQSAISLLNNAERIQNDETCRDMLIKSLLLNPYESQGYLYALKRFSDPDGTLEQAAEYFGILEVQNAKKDILEDFANTFSLDTEEKAKEAKRQVCAKIKELHYQGNLDGLKRIQTAIHQLDVQYRTVDGILFPSRKESDLARQELREIQSILGGADPKSLVSLTDAQKKISGYQTAVAKKYQDSLSAQIKALDISMRTVTPPLPNAVSILCASAEEAAKLNAEVQELQNALSACGDGAAATGPLTAFRQRLQNGPEDEVTRQYLSEVDQRLAQIELQSRTALGRVYDTPEQAVQAQKLYESIQRQLLAPDVKQQAAQLRCAIKAADFSDKIKNELTDQLFQAEHATLIKILTWAIIIAAAIFMIKWILG